MLLRETCTAIDILTKQIIPLYQSLLAEEQKHPNAKDGMLASFDMVSTLLSDQGVAYDQFIATL